MDDPGHDLSEEGNIGPKSISPIPRCRGLAIWCHFVPRKCEERLHILIFIIYLPSDNVQGVIHSK